MMFFKHSCPRCLLVSWTGCPSCKRVFCGNCSRKENAGQTLCPDCPRPKPPASRFRDEDD